MRQVKALYTLMQSIEQRINDTATPCVMPRPEPYPLEDMLPRGEGIIEALRQNGYTCIHTGNGWYRSNALINHNESFPLRDGRVLTRSGTHVEWRITTQEAAESLIRVFGDNQQYVMTGDGPMRITDQWGSIRAGYIEPSEPIGDSSDGIEPCGYDAL